MKTLFTIFFSLVVLFLSGSNSYSQLNGTYTVGSGGDYPTLSAAASDLSSQGINGPVILNILTGVYAENILLDSIPGTSIINTITIKSQTGNPNDVRVRNIPGNQFIFQIIQTSNLIIRDITISGSDEDLSKIQFQNECNNIKIINNIFTKDSLSVDGGIDISGYQFFGGVYNLKSLLIQNNLFKYGSVHIDIEHFGSSNFRIINNLFPQGGLDAIRLSSCDSILIEKNTCFQVRNAIVIYNSKSIRISKNIFFDGGEPIDLTDLRDSISSSIISNNFIISNHILQSVRFTNCVNILFIYNTVTAVNFFINYGAIACVNSSVISILNNIGIVNGTGFVMSSTNTTLLSDYNDFFKGGNPRLIFYNGISYDSLPPFVSATGLDQHSNSHAVTFVSLSDLHLAGSSIGDIQLEGIPNALVTDDIDGNPRSPLHPYKGADEPDVPLPVELSSFTSSIIKNNVTLKWTTSSEINNSGFNIERSIVNGQWKKIEFVQGNGTTITPKNYEFTDRNLSSGKYNYRLKQIDYSGNFEYHNLSNEVVIGVPTEFRLSQNYPNPFNPSTKIEYDLPTEAKVKIVLYDLSGREVMTLLNETKTAGYYILNFNGSNLSSGVYFYSINATTNDASFEETKRMVFLK